MDIAVPSRCRRFSLYARSNARFPGLFIGMLCALSLLPLTASAQAVSNAWTSLFSVSNAGQSDFPSAMTLDAAGNVYVTGSSLTTDGYYRLVTVKYDSQGNEVWSALYHTNSVGFYYTDLQIEDSGKLIVTAEFDPGTLVIKYDENGNQLAELVSTNIGYWSRRIPQPSGAFSLVGIKAFNAFVMESYDAAGGLLSVQKHSLDYFPYRLLIDSATNIVVGGDISDANSQTSIAVTKYDSTGHLLWEAAHTRPDGNCYFYNFATDTNGNTFVAALFQDTNSDSSIILLKFDSQGNQAWVSNLDDNGDLLPYGMEVDGAGNLLIIQAEFKVTKCDSNGNRIWQSRAGPMTGPGNWNSAHTVDRAGQIYLSGGFVNFGPPGSSVMTNNSLTVKFDTEGHELWAHANSNVPGSFAMPAVIKTDDSNNVYVTAYSFDTKNNAKFLTTKYSQSDIDGVPFIIHDPESLRATAFTTATFTVSATGNGPLTYQWSHDNQPIPGMTNASLILTNLAEDAGGAYSVVVSNAFGWIRSRDAILSLDMSPRIFLDPLPLSLAQGESSVLHVLAHGDPPLSFQWQQNGTNVGDASDASHFDWDSVFSSSLVLSNVSLGNRGDYRVIVSNAFGMVTSSVSQVRISRHIVSKWSSSFTGTYPNYFDFTATDVTGNFYVSGTASDSNGIGDYFTVKFAPTGQQLWSRRYTGMGGNDIPAGIFADRLGNVYVTGDSQNTNGNYEVTTIKYDTEGNVVWVARIDETFETYGANDHVSQIAVDDESNVFITGTSYNKGIASYITAKYSSDGQRIWTSYAQTIASGWTYALALDQDGDVLVGGNGGIIKYNSAGTELWRSDPHPVYRVKVDTNNNVYALTSAYSADTDEDYGVEKYDSEGDLQWSSTYFGSGASHENSIDFCVTEDGSAYVAGTADGNQSVDYVTVKFDTNGQLLWTARFSDGLIAHNLLRSLATDASGNAYITGITSSGGVGYITTLKYDLNCNQVWASRKSVPNENIVAMDVIVHNETNVFVTSITFESDSVFTYTVFAYEQNDLPQQPSILTLPQGQMVFVNSNAVLNVAASGEPLQYQWRHFGKIIPGATDSSFIIPNFQPLDGGDYSVIVDDGFNTTISPEARLIPYTQLFSPTLLPTNQFKFSLVGERSRIYEIQRSSDLLTWDSITNVFNTNGIIEFTDLSLTNNAKRFYRAKKSHPR